MQLRLRGRLLEKIRSRTAEELRAVVQETPADTIYQIDADSEEIVVALLSEIASEVPFLLIAEGFSEGEAVPFPKGANPDECLYRVILDPIDGTRMLMNDKRSAWTLAAAAPNKGEGARLADIEIAVMTELPTSKQYLAETIWASRGQGVGGWRENLTDGSRRAWRPTPSQSDNLHHAFAQFTKFFPGGRASVCRLEEEIFREMGVFREQDRTRVFDDQYLSTGGQIYELLAGHDLFQADIRAGLRRLPRSEGPPPGIAAHPYDLCVELIAREAGILITDLEGRPLDAPLDTTTDVDWIAYANRRLYERMWPIVRRALERAGLTG